MALPTKDLPQTQPRPAFLEKLHAPGKMPDNISICIYGREGVGKTTLASSMPGHGYILEIPTSEGAGDVPVGHLYPRVQVHTIYEWAEIEDDRKFLQYDNGKLPAVSQQTLEYAIQDPRWSQVDEWHNKRFDWIAIDSMSGMQELATKRTLKERGLDFDPQLIRRDDWGKIGRYLGELIHNFMVLPIHTIWIAHEQKREDNTITTPAMTPMALDTLRPAMMVIGRLSVRPNPDRREKVDRLLRIGPHPNYVAKYRAQPYLDVPHLILDPDLNQLKSYLLQELGSVRPAEAEDTEAAKPLSFSFTQGSTAPVSAPPLVLPDGATANQPLVFGLNKT